MECYILGTLCVLLANMESIVSVQRRPTLSLIGCLNVSRSVAGTE